MFALDALANKHPLSSRRPPENYFKNYWKLAKKEPNHSNYSVARLINKTLSIASRSMFQSFIQKFELIGDYNTMTLN